MQTSLLPVGVCDEVEAKIRNFLWGDTSVAHKPHLVGWEQICMRKDEGGLGIRSLRLNNEAFLMKVAFRLMTDRDALWCKVLRSKYGCGVGLVPEVRNKACSSNLWKGISKVWPQVLADSLVTEDETQVRWKGTADGCFTVRSAYESLTSSSTSQCPLWKSIWKWRGPERVKTFLWLLRHDKLLTNANRVHRHMAACALCPRCHSSPETALHAIRDCPVVSNCWLRLVHPALWASFFSGSLEQWLLLNMQRNMGRNKGGSWKLCFGFACWILWNRRNTLVFENRDQLDDVVLEVFRRVHEFTRGRSVLHDAGLLIDYPAESFGYWKRPALGWAKLNTDGVCQHGGRVIAAGGVLRDCLGGWIQGFMWRGRNGDVLQAELSGIAAGLRVAWSLGLENIYIESDSLEALSLAEHGCSPSHPLYQLVMEVTDMLSRAWTFRFSHVFREQNLVADRLAQLAVGMAEGLQLIGSPPMECAQLVFNDAGEGSVAISS